MKKYLLMLLPKVKPIPTFDLIEPVFDLTEVTYSKEGILVDDKLREMTKEESVLLAEYKEELNDFNVLFDKAEEVLDNFTSIHASLWDLNISGTFLDIISSEKASTVLKEGLEYQVYCLPTERIRASDLAELLSSTFKDSNVATLTDDPQAWLRKNSYTYPVDKE